MEVKKLRIEGFRGFSKPETIDLSTPDGDEGSGITFIVGPNNAGKSTIIDSFMALNHGTPSFSEGKRNDFAGDSVSIEVLTNSGEWTGFETLDVGGGQTQQTNEDPSPDDLDLFCLPSRRDFKPFFPEGQGGRRLYASEQSLPHRGGTIDWFSNRLFEIQRNRADFNEVLGRVLESVPDWYIDQNDEGDHYLKYRPGASSHTSDGLGDGYVSLLFLIDVLYDSEPGETIAIDEPELSLHPPIQRRLMELFAHYSSNRQIVISTHSPYFVDWDSLFNGADLARVHLTPGEGENPERSTISQVSRDTIEEFEGLSQDLNNPHILGLDSREVFFLRDGVVLVEGQDDVQVYKKLLEELGLELPGSFWGWGAGGAGNIPRLTQLLSELGFRRVTGLFDADQQTQCDRLSDDYPDYFFETIPAEDVRTKKAKESKERKEGLTDSSGDLKEEHRDATYSILEEVGEYLEQDDADGV